MGLLDPPGFRRNRLGQVWLHLTDHERALLSGLLDQMAVLLAPPERVVPLDPLAELIGIDEAATRPEDPALARLFPDAYSDPEEADAFRRFTQADLRSGKLASLTLVATSLQHKMPTRLSEDEQRAWLGVLNDLRLTLGTRLEMSEDSEPDLADLAEDDPIRVQHLIYDWLTYHQDRLITAMSRGLR